MTVLHNPNPELREQSRLVTDEELKSSGIQTLIDNMLETMKVENGVGLAAPQVGEHLRIIIVETANGPEAFVNPKIVSRSFAMTDSQEGCLSIPGVFGWVKRHKSIKLRALDRHGKAVNMKVKGFPAIIFQHEIDHLDGILFIDRAHKVEEITPEVEGNLI